MVACSSDIRDSVRHRVRCVHPASKFKNPSLLLQWFLRVSDTVYWHSPRLSPLFRLFRSDLSFPDPNDPIAGVLYRLPGTLGGCQTHSLTVHHDPRTYNPRTCRFSWIRRRYRVGLQTATRERCRDAPCMRRSLLRAVSACRAVWLFLSVSVCSVCLFLSVCGSGKDAVVERAGRWSSHGFTATESEVCSGNSAPRTTPPHTVFVPYLYC